MDIFREQPKRMYRSAPETDRGRQADKNPLTDATARLYSSIAVASGRTATDQPASSILSTPSLTFAEEPNRFLRHYVDPLIPCKAVSYAAAKRAFDCLLALFILALVWPLMLLAALLVKLSSPGPVLFRQVRVGKGGRHFWCYKFRSMCQDAEAQKASLLHLNEASGPVFKIKADPRVTRVGSVLRKLSIDELPQLLNVLKGDMSLVGPRPPVPSEVAQYGSRERGRLAVQPGLTCLWQIGGRSNVSFDHWMELDLLYIETMSLHNDCKILVKTIPAVLKGSGAH